MQSDPFTVQRLRGGYAIVWQDAEGKRRRHALSATDRIGAEAEARQRWRLGNRSARTVGDIVEAYLADRRAEGIVTANRQSDAWKAMRDYWAAVSPNLIDKEMARGYAARRRAAPATVRYELSMLSVALRWAKDEKLIDNAPEIWRPSPPERRKRHLSHAEFEKFFAAVKAPHARLYVLLGLYTMARPAALLDLTWDRVNWQKGTIDLNPEGRVQTAKRRADALPLNEEALDALKEAWRARQSEYVIERGGKRIANVKKLFQAASERCGFHVTAYMLRHTGAVWAAEAGAPMTELAQFMGHEDSRTTERHYARFTPGHLRGVASRIQRRAGGQGSIEPWGTVQTG
ncbi:tyrosine-type recombinase/integrase [Sphingomonas colocasiae]|uniref:Site-specific integrase n=1 Tax=Sphingomonas colocasiae TaxID=1848973 RepID=A0ABS7Q0J4_9SPHN|nr:site-specific integrase [Sphingomonas colocasiae]MBY8826082.1 site-specific integrase [Sphingomonas colocasiae]